MARSIAIIFILVLAAVQTLALPGGGEATKPGQKKPTNYNATWSCTYKYKGLCDKYKLTGRDWGVNETMLRKCVDKAGIVTKWNYSNWTKDGHAGFISTFNLPLASAQRLGTHSNQELGINPFNEDENGYLLTGVECGSGKIDD